MANEIRNLNLMKLKALLDYINNIYSGKFDNVELCIEHGRTRYRYVHDDVLDEILAPEIVIGAAASTEFDDFIIKYYNEEFDLNLENTPEIRLIQELCHECGHHYNMDYYKNREEEYFKQLQFIYEQNLEDDEHRKAYRKIDEEYDADTFAANIIKEHLPAMIELLK